MMNNLTACDWWVYEYTSSIGFVFHSKDKMGWKFQTRTQSRIKSSLFSFARSMQAISAMLNCALMYNKSNQYRRKCLSKSLQLVTCTDMFKVISDIMAYWYDTIIIFIITINFCNGKKMILSYWCLSIAIIMEWKVLEIYYS